MFFGCIRAAGKPLSKNEKFSSFESVTLDRAFLHTFVNGIRHVALVISMTLFSGAFLLVHHIFLGDCLFV